MKKAEYSKPYAVIEILNLSENVMALSEINFGEGDSEDFENMFN